MTIKITQPIVGWAVAAAPPPQPSQSPQPQPPQDAQPFEALPRPAVLIGATYKLKPPLIDHAMYITINDIVLNPGTDREQRRPYEIFINTKGVDHFQWIVALTRVISAVFRKGGEVDFLVEELCSVFDPKGGWFDAERHCYIPSLVAAIGYIVGDHLQSIGLRQRPAPTPPPTAPQQPAATGAECPACHQKTMQRLDGCWTCTSCGDSKCG